MKTAADFSEGDWRWIVDFTNVTYTDWHAGQPDNSGGHEDCLEIEKVYSYQWNDSLCTVTNGYICESEKVIVNLRYVAKMSVLLFKVTVRQFKVMDA